MKVKILDASSEIKYENYVLSSPNSLLYVSNKYRKLLKDFLKAEDVYFIAEDDNGRILGALPTFIFRNSKGENVLNSIPFYGSNGGLIEFDDDITVRDILLESFSKFAIQNSCVSSTIISNPLNPMEAYYEIATQYTFKDSRIGQLSPLPVTDKNAGDAVMQMIHTKTRNMVRKAQKLDVKVTHGNEKLFVDFLVSTHHENMATVNGLEKPSHFFDLIPKHFDYGKDYKIYVAKLNGELIAGLLVFYFNATVEYYTPVIKSEFRNSQALSLLIFEAMKEATCEGYKWWNWGGTWKSQAGVFQFKEQWGTVSKNYYYYTRILNDSVLEKTRHEILLTYPYFYVAPFDKIFTNPNGK